MGTFTDRADTTTKSRRLSVFYGFLLFCIVLAGLSCREVHREVVVHSPGDRLFYDAPKNKLWGHKANSPELAQSFLQNFAGIEFDVVFEGETNRFNIRHDVESPSSSYYLEDFLKIIAHRKEVRFWLDFKNLSGENVKSSGSALVKLLQDHDALDQCIVESYNLQEVIELNKGGLYVSFWVPYLDENSTTEDSLGSRALIQKAIDSKQVNALSAPYQMYSFLNAYFPEQNIHLWTNGLAGEQGISEIRALNTKQNIKVILVDYATDFLREY